MESPRTSNTDDAQKPGGFPERSFTGHGKTQGLAEMTACAGRKWPETPRTTGYARGGWASLSRSIMAYAE